MSLTPDFDLDGDLSTVLSIDPVKLLYNWSNLPKSTLTHAAKAIQLVLSSVSVKHTTQAGKPASNPISEERDDKDKPVTRKRMSEERDDRRRKRARTEEWTCHNCDLTFRTQAELRRHEKKHPAMEKSIDKNHKDIVMKKPHRKCNICDDEEHTTKQEATIKKESIKDQKPKHGTFKYNVRKRWRCAICKRTLCNKGNLKRHYDTLHALKGTLEKRDVKSQKVTVAEAHKEPEIKDVESIIFVCDCTMATAKVDCAVEHAQLHHLEGYKPILQTCDACKFTFETLYFADHLPNQCDNELKPVTYSSSKLLNAEWCDMFPKLSEVHINRIKYSSIYEHTRKVKMNCDDVSGKPLYQCETCELFVSPKEVEDHCNKENDCLENQSIEHFCCDCEIFFYTSEALKEHENEHEEGHGFDSFRIVTFNCKRDATINRVLRHLHNNLTKKGDSRGNEAVCPAEVPAVETQQCNIKNKRIEILDNRLVNVRKLCCGKFIPLSELEAHKETHRDNNVVELEALAAHQHIVQNVTDEKNQRIKEQVSQDQNIIIPDNKNQKVSLEPNCEMKDKNKKFPGDNSSQHTVDVFKNSNEDTIDQENNNSCGNIQSNGIFEEANMKRDAGIKILGNRSLNVSKLCCGKFTPLSELEAHKETHKDNNVVELEALTAHQHIVQNLIDEKNQRIEEQVSQEQKIIIPDNKNQKVPLEPNREITDKNETFPGDNSSQHTVDVLKNSNEDTIDQENSNSCGNLQSNGIFEEAYMKKDAGNAESKVTTPPRDRKKTVLDDNFSEEMKNELRQELQKIINEGNTEKDNCLGNKELNQDHEEIKHSELILETLNTNEPNENKVDNEKPLDASNEKNKIQQNKTVANTANSSEEWDLNDIIEILDSDEEKEISVTKIEIKNDESEYNPRPSSRYILSKMLPSASCESDLTDAIEKVRIYEKRKKSEHQQFIEETRI